MVYAGKILISAIIISFFVLQSCTKVEDDIVVPDALPYSAKLEEKVHSKGYNFSIAITYDSINETDHLELLKVCVDSTLYRNYVKAKCVYFLGLPSKEVDEITLNNIKYKDVKFIELFPRKVDGNNNGFLDEILLLEYTDSIVLQMHDHKVSSNIPYYSHSFLREDNHIINSIALWNHPVDSTQYLVFVKSNRLIWSKAKTCDTLIFLNIRTKEVKSTPIGASISNCNTISICSDSLLILFGATPRNYHPSYLGFDDCHSYLMAYKSDGSIFWADTLSNFSNSRTAFIRNSINSITAIIYGDINTNKFKMKSVDNLTGKYIKEVECEDLTPYTFSKVDNKNEFVYFKDNKLIAYDTALNIVRTKEFPFSFYLHWHKIGMITNYYSYKEKEAKVDINSNGADDFLITSIKNQLLMIDGKTFDILFATPPFNSEIHYGIVRKKNNSPQLVIVSDNNFYRYLISETSLFVRVKSYFKNIINYILFLLLVVIIVFLSYKIYYFSFLYKLLNTKSQTQGVIIFSSIYGKKALNLEKKLRRINNKSIDILSLQGFAKKEIYNKLPKQVLKIVNSTFNQKDNLSLDLTFEPNNETKYLEIKTYHFSIIIKNYCVVIITDLTARIKSEILTTSITIAHDAKNQLATIQQNILNLFDFLEDNYEIQKDYLSKKKQKIIKKINDSSFTMMKLLFAANVPNFYKSTINFSSFIDEWIEDKILRYQYEDITFINNIDKNLPLIEVSENQISFLLQCACDNADQAMPKDQKERIIEFSSHLNNQYLEIGIKDNGIGISEEILNSINTNHFTTKATGTGLGLKIIKSVVEKHNALLSIQSKLHNGTQLLIKFPINERI